MKNVFFLIVLLFATSLSFAQSQVWVSGYYRSNGTYVPGHYRTEKNHTINDNWTTRGNVNPHTGKAGTIPRSYSYSNTSYKTVRSTYTPKSYSSQKYPTSSYTNYSYSTPSYSTPSYSSYTNDMPYFPSNDNSTPSYNSTSNSSQTIYTGPRGGTYYINSNGNKTYIN